MASRNKSLGILLVSNEGILTSETVLSYFPTTDELTVFQRFRIEDSYVGNAGVYSLVDFMPGAMYASPDPHLQEILEFCSEVRLEDLGECRKRFPEPAPDSISIKSLLFRFDYPKEIGMDSGSDLKCKVDGRNWLTKIMPLDVDDGTLEGPEADRPLACEALRNSLAGQQ